MDFEWNYSNYKFYFYDKEAYQMSLKEKFNKIATEQDCELKQRIPWCCERNISTSMRFTELAQADDIEAIRKELFTDSNWKLVIWHEGDYEKIPASFWEEHEELISWKEYNLIDRCNKEWKYSLCVLAEKDEDGGCRYSLNPRDVFVTVLELIYFNRPKLEEDNKAKMSILKTIHDVLNDNNVLGYDCFLERELYPMGANDYIFFEKENSIQTTLFDKDSSIEYENIHIKGASKNFYVENDYCGDCTDVCIRYAWAEQDKKFEAFIMKEGKIKKLLEDIFGIPRCSAWDDCM